MQLSEGKMRFFPSGPNFPDELLEARDAGNVVFFCGAGLSSPALPGFSGLAEQVISEFGPPPGSDARAILDQLRNDTALSAPLDQVFNLLHEEYGAAAVEHVVHTILKDKAATAPTEQHSIVLRLSRSAGRKLQLVTTNFDRLFEKAQKGINSHIAPGLPDLASGEPLEGLVYLHGRMPTQPSDGIKRLNFVLSSADFGRAYLADGWATRFVRELLQRYVIVLLGYSASDPPIRRSATSCKDSGRGPTRRPRGFLPLIAVLTMRSRPAGGTAVWACCLMTILTIPMPVYGTLFGHGRSEPTILVYGDNR
jgi:hypothetical protein